MGLITRNTKTGGNTTFAAEYAAGYRTIKAAEVDADFNTIYSLVNGNIESANLAAASIGTTNLVNLAVNEAKLAANAVSEAKIAAGAVTSTKIGSLQVSSSHLAYGAAGVCFWAAVPDNQAIYGTWGETTMWTSPTFTARGNLSYTFLFGSWGAYISRAGTGTCAPLFKLYRNSTNVFQVYRDYTALAVGQTENIIPPLCVDAPPATSVTYYIKVTPNMQASDVIYTPASNSGAFWILQIS